MFETGGVAGLGCLYSIMMDTSQASFQALRDFLNARILDQQRLVSRMLVALLADGHLLVEGAPGLAKTRAVKTLATGLQGDFKRIQFTPDLLPSDLIGTDVYHPQDASFDFQRGPLFHHIIVADEVNRAPARVQSALLEAMEERQISVGMNTYPLGDLFFVMATQNPIEHEGTYNLPEAQLDRFLLKLIIDYPDHEAERSIMQQARQEALGKLDQGDLPGHLPLSQQTLFAARREVLSVHLSEAVEIYISELVRATRQPGNWSEHLQRWISFGASPRASIALDRCSRALAWLDGRDYVSPDDVQALAHEVFRHRLILDVQAEIDGIGSDQVINELLQQVPVI